MEPIQIDIPLKDALSLENIRVAVPSVFTVAIGTESEVRQNAAVRLLGLTHEQIKRQAQDIIFGQLRQVIASMTIEELQTKYLEVVGRSTGSDDRRYLIWKIREAEKGRINVGPRKTRARDGEPLDVKILPLRLEADVADKMDEAWRAKGIKNRMEFFRGAIGHYLAHLGARDAAALFTNAGTTGA